MRTKSRLQFLPAICRLFLLSLIFLVAIITPASAQNPTADLPALMERLVSGITEIESAWNPMLDANLANTRRLEVSTHLLVEIQPFADHALSLSDTNSIKLCALWEEARGANFVDDSFLPLLEELWVRAITSECISNGITTQDVADYVRTRLATFVADRGDFMHMDFDESTLTSDDRAMIGTFGFGLAALVNMPGGPELAVELYRDSGENIFFYEGQLIWKGAELDIEGLPMILAVLDRAENDWGSDELCYSFIAGLLLGYGDRYGRTINPSLEWSSVIADRVYNHIRNPVRLSIRQRIPFYGPYDEFEPFNPETLLGILGLPAVPKIASLLTSTLLMENVTGLDALRWFDTVSYPVEAGELYGYAEPLMGSDDFTLSVLAMGAFESDARYTGVPYDDARRERLNANLPLFCALMNRALNDPAIDSLNSTVWIDIFTEGSLTDGLRDCMPMVARIINSSWVSRTEGQEIFLPESEVDLISCFIPADAELFNQTSDSVRNFLESELDSDTVNPFRAWTYVNYLKAARDSGMEFSEEWVNDIMRLRAWAEGASAMVNGDELRSVLDELIAR